MIKRIKPGKRFCEAVVVNGIVTTAGVTGDGADTVAQTRDILATIDGLLAEAGTDKRALVSVQVVLADITDAPAMNRAWDAWLDPAHKPARMTIQAPLVNPAWKVEITGVALAPR